MSESKFLLKIVTFRNFLSLNLNSHFWVVNIFGRFCEYCIISISLLSDA